MHLNKRDCFCGLYHNKIETMGQPYSQGSAGKGTRLLLGYVHGMIHATCILKAVVNQTVHTYRLHLISSDLEHLCFTYH